MPLGACAADADGVRFVFQLFSWPASSPMEGGGPAESPAVRTTSEPRRSSSSAHRHLSRRNGLAKLCQSRMALSGTRPFWASWVAVSKTQARGRSGLWPLCLFLLRGRALCAGGGAGRSLSCAAVILRHEPVLRSVCERDPGLGCLASKIQFCGFSSVNISQLLGCRLMLSSQVQTSNTGSRAASFPVQKMVPGVVGGGGRRSRHLLPTRSCFPKLTGASRAQTPPRGSLSEGVLWETEGHACSPGLGHGESVRIVEGLGPRGLGHGESVRLIEGLVLEERWR